MHMISKGLMGAVAAIGLTAIVPAAQAGMASAVSLQPQAAPIALGSTTLGQDASFQDRRDRDRRYDRRYARGDQRVGRDTRIWRGKDGRYRCKKDNGTTGLLIGGAVGGLAGNEIAGRGDKLLGTVIGAGAGALLGREIDRDKYRCR